MRSYDFKSALTRHPEITPRSLSVRDLQERFQPTPRDSIMALLIKLGPFIPTTDAFQFRNDFKLTSTEAVQVPEVIPGVILDLVSLTCINEIKDTLSKIEITIPTPWPLPDITISLLDAIPIASVIDPVAAYLVQHAGEIILVGPVEIIDADLGLCGGMAFGGYDFYLQGWPVDGFGSQPPVTGELREYLFKRLLDSLKLNGDTFVEWWTKVHVLKRLPRVVTEAVLASAGTVGGPVGAVIGALIGHETPLIDLGGPKTLLEPTKAQWPLIKNKLDAEATCPIGLIFSNKLNLFDQHQVLAFNYADNGVGPVSLDIWDNKDGSSSQTLTIDFGGDELQVSGAGVTDDNRHIKGIFLEEYAPHQPPSSLGPL